jgi:hypothetical protein
VARALARVLEKLDALEARRLSNASIHTCDEGWICEQHPDQPWPHGYTWGDADDGEDPGCPGPGIPCPARDCVFWNNGQHIATSYGELIVTREQAFGWKRRWS